MRDSSAVKGGAEMNTNKMFLISRTCHDPEFVMHVVDMMVQAHEDGDPRLTPDDVFKEAMKAHREIYGQMVRDTETAQSVFREMIDNEKRARMK